MLGLRHGYGSVRTRVKIMVRVKVSVRVRVINLAKALDHARNAKVVVYG